MKERIKGPGTAVIKTGPRRFTFKFDELEYWRHDSEQKDEPDDALDYMSMKEILDFINERGTND